MTWHCNQINCVDVVFLYGSSEEFRGNSRTHKKISAECVCARGLVASAGKKKESGRKGFSCLFLLDTTGSPLGFACAPLFLLSHLLDAEFLRIFLPALMIPSRHFAWFSMETFSFHNCPSLQVPGNAAASQPRSVILTSSHSS